MTSIISASMATSEERIKELEADLQVRDERIEVLEELVQALELQLQEAQTSAFVANERATHWRCETDKAIQALQRSAEGGR